MSHGITSINTMNATLSRDIILIIGELVLLIGCYWEKCLKENLDFHY